MDKVRWLADLHELRRGPLSARQRQWVDAYIRRLEGTPAAPGEEGRE